MEMLAHALDGLPDEACGLLAARPDGAGAGAGEVTRVERFYPCRNAAASARVYEVDTRDLGRANWDALQSGLELVGVYHSHTHTDAYPSPTDVAQAADQDPAWHYVVVSLRHPEPVLRSYRIAGGVVAEEPVAVEDPGGR
jgi:proteasome lid subunit RPN8/RPN11